MKALIKQFVAGYLGFWARLVLRERRPRIIGVTGSVGKTTTKEAIFCALSTQSARVIIGTVGKSAGNLNTEIGLPLAVLAYDEVPEGFWFWLATLITVPIRALVLATLANYPAVLVLEYAADRPGDIRRLVAIAPPEMAVVTAAGPAHLALFKTVERVAREKAELIRSVSPAGLVVLARDDSFTSAMARDTHAPVIKVSGRGKELAVSIAKVIAEHLHIPPSATAAALKKFNGLAGRLVTQRAGKMLILDDTYNANPLSMALALDTLFELAPKTARRVAILGFMAELGAASEEQHIEIGRYARSRVEFLIAVGRDAQLYNADYWYPSSQAAAASILDHIRPTDAVLVKGSRSAKMEKVVTALTDWSKEGYGNH